jgi:serine/threonine protein kinase
MNYGRYQIVGELGKGSMGVVYQAHDPQIDRLVALKALRQDRLTSEDFVHRFLKEAKAIGRLSHPNIVTVYDVGEDHGTIYIAMEFLEGEPLNKVIEENKLSLKEIIQLGIQAAETLDYAHQKGIVHRDIKPSNILVQASGQIKITDFGIAHIEDPSASVQTQAGEILGTPAYMSPEQVMSRPVDGRSDLFSLGIILYELSTGKRPFGGGNLAAIFSAITQETLSQPSKVNPAIPQDLSQIIMKCLNKKPEERFQTGMELAGALRSSLKRIEPTAVESKPTPKKSKNIVFLIIGIAIFLGIIGSLSYIYLIPKEEIPNKVENIKSGFLKVESIPEGAQLFVDGTFKGQTPTKLDLPAGKHEVRLTLPDHYDWEAQVQLKEEGETPLMIRLIPISEKKS